MRHVASAIGSFAFAHLWQWQKANEVPVQFCHEQIPMRVLWRIAPKVALNVAYNGVDHGSNHEREHERARE